MAVSARDSIEVDRAITEFLDSLAPDIYSERTFVPWDEIEAQVRQLAGPIAVLQALSDRPRLTAGALADALDDEPDVAFLIRALFTAPHAVGFSDGREIPEEFNPHVHDSREVARLLLDLGLRKVLPRGAQVKDLFRVAAIAVDSRRRGFRRKADLEARVSGLLESSIATVSDRLGLELVRLEASDYPEPMRGRGIEAIAASGRPVIGIATVFQAISGGRQYRDLAQTYPRVQEDLDVVPASLILIADGRGIQEASHRVLVTLFESVAACMTLAQAEAGALADAMETAAINRGARTTRRSSLAKIISNRLANGTRVTADDLPVVRETAELALAAYAAEHPELSLRLSADSATLEWSKTTLVGEAQRLRESFPPGEAVGLLADALDIKDPQPLVSSDELPEGVSAVVGPIPTDPVLPPKLMVAGSALVDETFVRATARAARRHVAGATLAVLITGDASDWRARADASTVQTSTATSVVVVDQDDLLQIVGSVRPRDALVQRVLEQADLTKASPFKSAGATPPEMFFGRQQEAADLMGILSSSSAAVIGGRRIGKTSLLHRVTDTLATEGWLPFYADLQQAGDWRTFAEHVNLKWQVEAAHDFSPGAVSDLVEQLRERGTGRLVLILDEIDNLLRWDQDHDDSYVSEAFFRACRALSQEGAAQFVFSGERTIAERLWDPASPHWNFCRPLMLRQLPSKAAGDLLHRPLASLGVELSDPDLSLGIVWDRSAGHPQIIQKLGEDVVALLNTRDPEHRARLSTADLDSVTDSAEFRRHYVTTYWGQATAYEQLLSALIALDIDSMEALRGELDERSLASDADSFNAALRMLALYGIIDDAEDPITLRATWLPEALVPFGGAERVASDTEAILTP